MQVDVYSFHHMRKTLMQEERIMAEKKKVIPAAWIHPSSSPG